MFGSIKKHVDSDDELVPPGPPPPSRPLELREPVAEISSSFASIVTPASFSSPRERCPVRPGGPGIPHRNEDFFIAENELQELGRRGEEPLDDGYRQTTTRGTVGAVGRPAQHATPARPQTPPPRVPPGSFLRTASIGESVKYYVSECPGSHCGECNGPRAVILSHTMYDMQPFGCIREVCLCPKHYLADHILTPLYQQARVKYVPEIEDGALAVLASTGINEADTGQPWHLILFDAGRNPLFQVVVPKKTQQLEYVEKGGSGMFVLTTDQWRGTCGKVSLVSAETGETQSTFSGETPFSTSSLTYSPKWGHLMCCGYMCWGAKHPPLVQYAIARYDLAREQRLSDLQGHTDWAKNGDFTRSHRLFVTGSNDQSVRCWDQNGVCVMETHWDEKDGEGRTTNGVQSIATSPTDEQLVYAGLPDGMIRVFDLRNLETPVQTFRAHQSRLSRTVCGNMRIQGIGISKNCGVSVALDQNCKNNSVAVWTLDGKGLKERLLGRPGILGMDVSG